MPGKSRNEEDIVIGSGRKFGSKQKKINWEVTYFDAENKRMINEQFETIEAILKFEPLAWLQNKGRVQYYQGTNGKNKKGILIKQINRKSKKLIPVGENILSLPTKSI